MKNFYVLFTVIGVAGSLAYFAWYVDSFIQGAKNMISEMSCREYDCIIKEYKIQGLLVDELRILLDSLTCLLLLVLIIFCEGVRIIKDINIFTILGNIVIKLASVIMDRSAIVSYIADFEKSNLASLIKFITEVEIWNWMPMMIFSTLFVLVVWLAYDFTCEYAAMLTGQSLTVVDYMQYGGEELAIEVGDIDEPTFYNISRFRVERALNEMRYYIFPYLIVMILGFQWPPLF